MNAKTLNIIKGIHPGIILERELKRRKIRKGYFALSIKEYPQTLVAVMKGRRRMNTDLALKIEKALDFDEGYFLILQVYHDIEEAKRRQNTSKPNLKKLRPVLFWDTRIKDIDWEKQKKAVIHRVFERGNQEEKKEIIRFYGSGEVNKTLGKNG